MPVGAVGGDRDRMQRIGGGTVDSQEHAIQWSGVDQVLVDDTDLAPIVGDETAAGGGGKETARVPPPSMQSSQADGVANCRRIK
jgi:hypothetical protein